jgi:hypothetical protein
LEKYGFYEEKGNALSSEELKFILMPILGKAEKIHQELVKQLKGTREWEELSKEERFEFENLSDLQKVQYGIAMSSLPLGFLQEFGGTFPKIPVFESLTTSQIMGCIGAALGFANLPNSIGLIFGSGLIAAKTAIQLVKALAVRYISGYLALAISIYEFVMCVKSFGISNTVNYNPNDLFINPNEYYYNYDGYYIVFQEKYCFLSIVNA